jgi:hypothetical protein
MYDRAVTALIEDLYARGLDQKVMLIVTGDMFRHLGIDHERTSFLDHSGRPMPILPYGTPIKELG